MSVSYRSERVVLARLPSGMEVATRVHVYGPRVGPTVYVQAAQHGREVNGIEVCRQLHDHLRTADLRGRVVVVPVADPLTFDRVSYTTPESLDSVHPNMNRVWPGDANGTLHQRMAATLWEYARDADAAIDLHTGSPEMLTHVVFREDDPESRRLAEAFGTNLLLSEQAGEDAPTEWSRRGFDGKFRVVASREGIPTITPELAHNKEIVRSAVQTGVDGVLDVLRELDLLEAPPSQNEQVVARNHLGSVDATESGLFHPIEDVSLGDTVSEGDPLGTVYDPTTYEVLQEAAATRSGILYSFTQEATVKMGDRLASVAIVRDEA